ncbi:hypothetical protein WUBG_04231 [Wuchereria bancrofti]|uniref:Cell division cycle protein 27 homolog n=1 Tax=Wuchereria bancrofti TaxID=6293 RepID=J9ERP1_WUCBA|nr:hypothetical protein WUBG_04231 [Wuchereria bancrofti]
MDVLEEKIKETERFRDCYYQQFPKSTLEEKKQAVREKVLPLIQDIPLDMNAHSSTSARYNYICGRILNICMDYDANCERYLSRAVKLDPSLSDAWYELGECVRKKEDFTTAMDCFRKSSALNRTGKCLASLAIVLRQIALCTVETKIQKSLQDEAAKLSDEAVKLDPDSDKAWHTLGNSCLMQFFLKYQTNMELMEKAQKAYERALQLGDVRYSPDLHLNYSTALKFIQNYGECLKHLKIANAYDPGFLETKGRLETLLSFLKQINSQVQRKAHFVGCDKEGSCCAFCIYNASNKFGLVIGDSVAVPEPHIVDVKLKVLLLNAGINELLFQISSEESGCENFDFRIVRISNPLKMLRNGKLVRMDCMAFCELAADFVH